MFSWTDLLVGVSLAFFSEIILASFQRLKRGFSVATSCPGQYWLFLDPFNVVQILIAPFFPPEGWLAHYSGKFSLYAKEGSTALSSLVIWSGTSVFWFADAEAIKTITSDRYTFRKEVETYEALNIYGKNVVTTDGEEWRRHLAVAGPAFNEATYSLNWSETLRLLHEWFEEIDAHTNVAVSGKVIDLKAAMGRLTLLIISSAGFGMRSPWSSFSDPHENLENTKDDILPFHKALWTTLEKVIIEAAIPKFAYYIPFRVPWLTDQMATSKLAFSSLKVHMTELVNSARSGGNDDGNLLHRLVQANDTAQELDEKGTRKGTLTDGELFSNIFVFLLAGHETSAHTLCFALTLLALYPDVQAELRKEVMAVWPTRASFTSSTFKEDSHKLEYTLAVFRETLRVLPAEPRISKMVERDCVLTATRFKPSTTPEMPSVSFDGGRTNRQFSRDENSDSRFPISIQRGSMVIMDVWALHMNPLVWGSDAHLFRPSRFIDTEDYKWPRDGFLAFSAGARGCLGQRFSLTESVCVLASVVRQYEILVPEDLAHLKGTEELKRQMLKWTTGITLTPTNAFVRFKKRVES